MRRENSWNWCGLLSRQVPCTGALHLIWAQDSDSFCDPEQIIWPSCSSASSDGKLGNKSKDCSGNLVLWLNRIDETSECTGVSLRLHNWYQWEPQQDLNKRQKIAHLAFLLAEQSFIISGISLETTHYKYIKTKQFSVLLLPRCHPQGMWIW